MAGKRIKGLTIEIDGNTTKLQTALKDVDAQLSKTQSSLRDVNRLLKLDPHNTELLGQKQRLLSNSIEQTKQRLETLKNAEKDAQKAFAEGKISEEQYNALKREIIDTENKLKSLSQTAGSLPFDTVGEKLQNVGGTVEGVGKKLMPVSAGAAAIGVASSKMAMDFEDSMANINTLLDDDSHLEGYESAIKNMSSETGISLDIVSSGMYQTISSIGDGGKETEKIFKTMGTAAKAGGAEVSDSVSLISAGMKGYNSVNDETAKKISDLAFQTAKLGVTTFPEMARSMQPLFPLASSLGFSMEELFGSMATLTGVTGNTSEVTTQLKAVMSGLMKPTGAMKNLLEEYGYANGEAMIQSEGLSGTLAILKEATGGQSDKMAELFGSTEALTAVTALTGPQFDVFNEKLGEMQDATGATTTAYDKMNTSGNSVRETLNNVKLIGVELGTTLLEILGPVIEGMTAKVQKFSEWFSNLSEGQKKVVGTILLLVAGIGPLLVIVGKAITLAGTLSKGIGAVNGMLKAAKVAGGVAKTGLGLFSGPILPLIAIIGALVAAGVLLYKNWDKIKEKAGALKDFVLKVWNSIKAKTSEVWNGIKNTISDKITAAKDKVKSIIDKIKGLFSFSWSLPKLKLPHIKYEVITVPVLGEIPNPKTLHVSWYKKAMDSAYMLKQPTIFGSMGGSLLGGGEAGNEMIIGENKLLKTIAQATNAGAMINATERSADRIIAKLDAYLPGIAQQQVILDSGKIVGELTPKINNNLGNYATMGRRGYI